MHGRRVRQTSARETRQTPQPRTRQLAHARLATEDVRHEAVVLALMELVPVGRHHARRVLSPVLQRQQALVQLSIGGAALLVDADDAARARRAVPAGRRRALVAWEVKPSIWRLDRRRRSSSRLSINGLQYVRRGITGHVWTCFEREEPLTILRSDSAPAGRARPPSAQAGGRRLRPGSWHRPGMSETTKTSCAGSCYHGHGPHAAPARAAARRAGMHAAGCGAVWRCRPAAAERHTADALTAFYAICGPAQNAAYTVQCAVMPMGWHHSKFKRAQVDSIADGERLSA